MGQPSEPPFGHPDAFECNWDHYDTGSDEWATVAYYQDPFGVVRLRGLAKMVQPDPGNCGDSESDRVIFVLPVGYRPADSVLLSTLSGSNRATGR